MGLTIDLYFVRELVKLSKEYFERNENETPEEFVAFKLKRFEEDKFDVKFEKLCQNFIIMMKHDEFFELTVSKFWEYYKLKHYNREIITTLMYVIIFCLDEDNAEEVFTTFTEFKYQFCTRVLEYFTDENNLVDVTRAGCKQFENDYVLQNILHPLLDKMNLIEEILSDANAYLTHQKEVVVKPVTVPNPPACATKKKQISNVHLPSYETSKESVFKSKEVSKNVLRGDSKVKEKLEKAREANKQNALKLLEFAREKAFKCATIPPKPQSFGNLPEFSKSKFLSKKVPSVKHVAIKATAASLMREAATLVKDKEQEMKKIEALTQTVFDPTTLEILEEHLRKAKEQENLQDIERKHLQGQLTYEEAILAKQRLLLLNQQRMEDFKKEREEILEEIELWRKQEQEKIRALVIKSQNIAKAAKDAEIKLYQEKRYQAKMVENESRQLRKEAYERKQEELAYKVKLIQELRALQQVRSLDAKEFDPTESPNFGFLCEMSIAELQERLGLLKMELQEELDRRRKAISESREKQQQLIESVKQFICQTRVAKPKPVPRSRLKLEQTPDLVALRERLQQAKQIRMDAKRRSVY